MLSAEARGDRITNKNPKVYEYIIQIKCTPEVEYNQKF